VIGDWGQPYAPAQRHVAAAMAEVARDTTSDFVVSTGDNFYRHGVRSVDDPQWRETFETVYSAPSLQVPWYAVLGNHDYEGSPNAEVAYSTHSARWRMRSRYWCEDMTLPGGESVSFFFLDTIPIVAMQETRAYAPIVGAAHEARAQLRWLETELGACTSSWKLAVGHHPIASSGAHGGSPAMARLVLPLFERHGVRAYFNGHDHDLEHICDGRIDYVCSGSGAAARATGSVAGSCFAYPHQGFAACALSRDELRLRFHDAEARQIYEASIARAA
jgi:tartrate-resistant acid phosphatase type 5